MKILKTIQWLIKTIFLQVRFFFRLSPREQWDHAKCLVILFGIMLGARKRRQKIVNTFFSVWDLPSFGRGVRSAVLFHNKLARVILDPKHKGIKAWEYGMLLSHVPLRRGTTVLDVGSGGSALPFYLHSRGATVTAFDLPEPLEKPNALLVKRFPQVHYDVGSMLALPYRNNAFDIVLCISAIEHLDYDFLKRQAVPYDIFLRHTAIALREMVRVLKPKGRLFVTSDIYVPDLQRTDHYPQAALYKESIGASYKREDFAPTFLHTLTSLGCALIGKPDFSFENLIEDRGRSNYRGRYMTTFALYAEKKI